MADALDFEASNRKCGACGETGHNARTCKSKSVPFSTGGFWNEKTFDGLEQLGLPFVDASHVAMISKIVDGEVLKEPNSRVAIPRMTWKEEPITMTRGELDEMCKAGDLISIGESRYSCSYLQGALAYLPKNTVLTCYTGYHYPLKATFEYGGDEWILFLAPRVEAWDAESFEAVVVNRGPPPKGAVAKTMMNHAMMEKAKIEQMLQELENKVRLGIISEDQLMKQLEKKFGADYEITISDEDMEKIAKSQGRTKEELETYYEQYENTTDVEVTDYYEEFKRKHPEMHEKFVDNLGRENYWYGDYKTNLFAKRKELKEMDIDFDMIDRYWEMNEDKIPERVNCSACDGEGIIITKYYPATREDPADADYVDCEMCDGEGTYLDGVFEAENEQEWINAHKEYAPTEFIIKRLKESGVWELGDDPYEGSWDAIKWWATVKIKDGTLVRATEDDFGDLTAINIILIVDEYAKGYGRVTVSYADVDSADWEDSFNDEMVKLGKEITTIFINNGMFHSGDDLEYGDMGEFYNVFWGDEIRHDCATNADLDIYEDDFIVMECNICGKTATYRQETPFYGPRNAEEVTPLEKEVNKYGLSAKMSKDELIAKKLKRLKDGFTKKNAENYEDWIIYTDKYEGNLVDKAIKDNSKVWVWSKWMQKNVDNIGQYEATAALLNDAPKILEAYKIQNDVLSTLDEKIRSGDSHANLMRTLEQELGLTETWDEMGAETEKPFWEMPTEKVEEITDIGEHKAFLPVSLGIMALGIGLIYKMRENK